MRALLCVLLAFDAGSVAGAPGKANAKGRDANALFLKRCSACHDPSRVYHRRADRAEWREIVDRMRRMPQSGISPKDADIILDYLVSLGGRPPKTPGRPAALGGRKAFDGWLSILEARFVRGGRVRLGGLDYEVARDGRTVTLRRKKRSYTVSLTAGGKPGKTARLDRWRVGKVTYELHLVLYEIRGPTVRLARALRRTG